MGMEELIQDIHARLAALGENQIGEERIKALIAEHLDGLKNDEEFVRKMRFGDVPEPKLVGTKYARWGLTTADIEFLYDLQESLTGQKRINHAGVYQGPSEELRNAFNAVSEAYYLPMEQVREIDRRAIDDLFPRIPLSAFHGRDREHDLRS